MLSLTDFYQAPLERMLARGLAIAVIIALALAAG